MLLACSFSDCKFYSAQIERLRGNNLELDKHQVRTGVVNRRRQYFCLDHANCAIKFLSCCLDIGSLCNKLIRSIREAIIPYTDTAETHAT